MRIYAIGDIHGYLSLLNRLYAKIQQDLRDRPVENHRLIFLGDYIDRGPESAACVQFLVELSSSDANVICLKGNHEDKLEAFLESPVDIADSFFTYGGAECAASYGVDMAGYCGDINDTLRLCAELKAKIPIHHRSFYADLLKTNTFGDYQFVHAGVRPGVSLDQQTERDLMWIRSEFIAHTGLYDKVIVHGHTPAYPMEVLPNRINVDTHAYETGVLSCLVLDGKLHSVLEA